MSIVTHDMRVDITGSVAVAGKLHAAVTIFAPMIMPPGRPIVMFGFPGGGYARGYFDLDLPGGGYSQARHHAAHGIVFVAVDHLGIGESSLNQDEISADIIAAANSAAVSHVLETLASGAIPCMPPVHDPVRIGIGQSMGACFLLLMQAGHRPFDAIGVLGFSAIQTGPRKRPGQKLPNGDWEQCNSGTNPVDAPMTREDWVWAFHHDSEPREIVERDMEGGYPGRSGPVIPPWGARNRPHRGTPITAHGWISPVCARIDVPIFIGNGERDVVPDPLKEPAYYPLATDVTLLTVPRMAHMHNFANTRAILWNRLVAWCGVLRDQAADR